MNKTKTATFTKNFRLVTAVAALALLAGCQTTPTSPLGNGTTITASDPARMTRSGFLSDYQRLKANPSMGGIECWYNKSVNASKYNKVLISKIFVSLSSDKDSEQVSGNPKTTKLIDPADLTMLTDYFHQALVNALKPAMQITDKPGPGVLVIRVALTDLVPTQVAGSLAGTLIPYAFVVEAGSGAATGRPAGSTPYLGETGMEMQFRDGESGAVLGECRDTEIGRKYAADINAGVTTAAQTWANGYLSSFQAWSYAKEAMDKWSREVAERIAEIKAAN